MLQPAKTKYRKMQRGTMAGKAYRGSRLSFGSYGLKALTRSLVSSRQIEAARQAIMHQVKRGGKVWIRIFPDKPITKTGAETPMGSGKGSVEFYAAVVKPGCIMFEMDGVTEPDAREAMRLAGYKLPVRSKFVKH